MAKEPDQNDPSNISTAYAVMVPRWDVINTVLGGTESMRAAGAKYLPKHQAEKDEDWKNRKDATTLYNGLEMILDNLASKPFAEPIKLGDDVPEQIKELTEDIDLQGNNLEVFSFNWFRDGLGKGFSHVLIEFPRVDPVKPDGTPRTAADDLKEKLRPYWVKVAAETIIFASSEIVNGVEKLKQVRILETIKEQVGFAEVEKKQIRVLEPGLVRIYSPTEVQGKVQWNLIDSYTTSLDYIPLVTFYASRDGFMIAKPPLIDIAYLNITHWQSSSDQRNILTVSRFPMLAVSGATEDDGAIEVGPRKFLRTSDANGRFYYVEPTGNAIEAGRQDLLDLEQKMFSQGTEFLKQKPGGMTATARALDSAESISPLQTMALSFKDAMELALQYTADWMKIESGGSVLINTEFGIEESTQADLQTLDSARTRHDISRVAYLDELVRRGILNEEYDAEDDKELIDQENANLGGMSLFDLDPNAPNEDPNDPNPSPTPEPAPEPAPAPPPKKKKPRAKAQV